MDTSFQVVIRRYHWCIVYTQILLLVEHLFTRKILRKSIFGRRLYFSWSELQDEIEIEEVNIYRLLSPSVCRLCPLYSSGKGFFLVKKLKKNKKNDF